MEQLDIFGGKEPQKRPIELGPQYKNVREYIEFFRKSMTETIRSRSYEGEWSPEVDKDTLLGLLEAGLKAAEEAAEQDRKIADAQKRII